MSTGTENAVLEPHLSDVARAGAQYPNPFFDLAQNYAPRTIKELFKWCTFFFYTNPLVGSTVSKISRYPITDLIIDESDDKTKDAWKEVFEEFLKIKDRMTEVNLDLNVYGNAFVSMHLPFTRMLICTSCNERTDIKDVKWRWKSYKFAYNCPKCGQPSEADPCNKDTLVDVPYRSVEDIKMIRWNPENIVLKYNEATARTIYYYSPSAALRRQVEQGDEDILEDLPLLFIKAIKEQRIIKLSKQNIFHLKRPTLAEKDMGWGKPLVYQVLKDIYYMYTLRRAQEAIANEHIVPFDFLFPQPNAQVDPFVHSDLGNWRVQVEDQIKKHRWDPNYKAIIPVPIGFGRLGGNGKNLMLTPELNYLNQVIVGGMGIPQEFLFGGLNWCCAPRHNLLTCKGMLKLYEICPNEIGMEQPKDPVTVSTRDGNEEVALVHRTSPKEQHSIRTRIGLNLTGSSIHGVWTLSPNLNMEWKHLEDIRPGDYVAFPKKTDLWGPKEPSKELCRILGYLVAEGSVTEKKIEFSNTNIDLATDFKDCIKKVLDLENGWFKKTFTESSNHYGQKAIYILRYQAKEAIQYFGDIMGFGYAEDKTVPRIIRESKKEYVFEFLKALFEGDGCNYISPSKKQTISYASKSETLLEEIQLLLLNAGIVSTIYKDYDNNVPCLQIRSEFAEMFLFEIGFITKNKTDDKCNPEMHRCHFKKYPFVLEKLKKLKERTGAWIKEKVELDLDKDSYTTKEVATLLKRDPSSILLYIRKGTLKATREKRKDGHFCTYNVKRKDLQIFLEKKGTSTRAAVGQTTWEINDNNTEYVNWEVVKELDSVLYEKYQTLKNCDFYWDEVVEKTHSKEKIEMCDLTVFNTHSYVSNGLVSHNTGSSVTLRSLQNDFIHNQTQLLDLVNWLCKKISVFLKRKRPQKIRFLDFKMADDIQRIQQLINLNAAKKVSDETMLTELGLSYEKEVKKIIDEIKVQNEIQDIIARSQARSSGESQIIQHNYQEKLQELQQKSMEKMKAQNGGVDPYATEESQLAGAEGSLAPETQHTQMTPEEAVTQPGYQDAQGQDIPGAAPTTSAGGQTNYLDVHKMVQSWATKLSKMPPSDQTRMLMQIKQQMPSFGELVEKKLNEVLMGATADQQTQGGINMTPLPEQKAPTRKGAV